MPPFRLAGRVPGYGNQIRARPRCEVVMAVESIEIAGRPIGLRHSPYIVAEMSGNHNGDIGRACALLDAAKEAGADAVKLQTYTADTITIRHDGPEFIIRGGLWEGRSLYDLYQQVHTPWEWHESLFKRARDIGITIFSTPFDATAVDFLTRLKSPAYKVASFELIDLPLVRKIASTGKPIVMSTGMADLTEIEESVAAARQAGAKDLILLHCVSAYPTPISVVNLRTMPDLAARFGVLAGLSDHSMGIAVPVVAVGLGAVLIEKHLTLRRHDGGPDSAFSLEPEEFKVMVRACRDAWKALGKVSYERAEGEQASVQFRRSLYVVRDVRSGEIFTEQNVRSIRPGYGLPPKELPYVLGRHAAVDIRKGTPLRADLVE